MRRATQFGHAVDAVLTVVVLGLAGCGGSIDDEPHATASLPEPITVGQVALPPTPDRQAEPATPSAADLADIRRQLTALRGEVAQLQRRLNQGSRPSTDSQGIPATAVQPSPPESERLARIEAQFRNEPADVMWSRGAVARVRTAVAEIGDGVAQRLRSVECRSKSCRLEVASSDAQPIDDTLPRIVVQLGSMFTTSNSVHIDEGEGRQAGVLFLTH